VVLLGQVLINILVFIQVQAETLIAENDDVAAGMMDLIKQCQITILIMGSVRNRYVDHNYFCHMLPHVSKSTKFDPRSMQNC
jgi:hypothetical protein